MSTLTDELAASTVEALVAKLNEGPGRWSRSWAPVVQRNAINGRAYRGANTLILMVAQFDQLRSSCRWATYKAWTEAGAQVRKGEHGTKILFWKVTKAEVADQRDKVYATTYTVFNADQVDNDPGTVIEPADYQLLSYVPVTIIEGAPAYSPSLDAVLMPPFHSFSNHDAQLATFAHELVHWTGHSTRLNREFGARFGDDLYAAEELVAELGSAMMCAHLGIDAVARLDHDAYLSSWITTLRAEPTVLWSVMAKAQAAVDHLLSYAPSSSTTTTAEEAPS